MRFSSNPVRCPVMKKVKKEVSVPKGLLRLEHRHVDTLRIPSYNPQIHDEENIEDIKRSIRRFGFVDPIIVRGSDGLVIAGAGRILALRTLWAEGWSGVSPEAVPCIVIECDDRTARMLMLALNRIQSVPDYALLAQVFKDLIKEGETIESLTDTGYRAFEISDLLNVDVTAVNHLLKGVEAQEPPKVEVEPTESPEPLFVTRSFKVPVDLVGEVDEQALRISKHLPKGKLSSGLVLVALARLVSTLSDDTISKISKSLSEEVLSSEREAGSGN